MNLEKSNVENPKRSKKESSSPKFIKIMNYFNRNFKCKLFQPKFGSYNIQEIMNSIGAS
jgi:hypothetical protein